jgi:S1-C subfamily serine protease
MSGIADLVERMQAKRESGSHPYVLVLGAGASVSSGTSLNRAVVERVVGSDDLQAFDTYLERCSDEERFAILRDLVEGAFPSLGYQCLAELISAGYFDVILSTNFDPLLEDAIAGQHMRRRDYVFLVHGVMQPDFIATHLDNRIPRVKILKLHGDLFYRKFYYTGEEIEAFPRLIRRVLETYLNQRDLLIVGHGMRDRDINRCLKAKGGAIWYVGPQPPSGEIAQFMQARRSEYNFIAGDEGAFDAFFIQLRAALLGGTAEASVDEIKQAIFRVGLAGQPSGSGFVLGDTGLLVTDSSVLDGLAYRAGLTEEMALGFAADVWPFVGGPARRAALVIMPRMGLDYAVFRVHGLVEVSPLELAAEPPTVGEPVTACISVGDSQGFHDGAVTGVDRSIPIAGMRTGPSTVGNLIETNIKTSPGASGAPLVRKDGRVVGMIVAGEHDAARSFALTSVRLRDMLAHAGLLSHA